MLRHPQDMTDDIRRRHFRIEPEIVQAVQNRLKRTRHLHAGKVLADADMRSGGKSEMFVLAVTEDVERIRVLEE